MRVARGNASGARRASRLATGAAALASLLALAMPALARAEVKPVTCSNLQSTVTSLGILPAHGEGDTLVLGELCTSALAERERHHGPGESRPHAAGRARLRGGDRRDRDQRVRCSSGTETGAITLEGLTFEHASTSGASAVSLRASRVTIQGDSFLENTEEGVTAAALFVFAGEPSASTCPPAGGAPAYVLRDSTLRGNRLTVASGAGGGGAAFLEDQCPGASHLIEGNAVEGNVLRSKGSTELLGGGVEAASEAPEPAPLTQRANIFAGNRIEDETGVGDFGGGGEWLTGLSLSSVADRFSGNSIAGTSGGHWSWGGGLGILACRGTTRDASTLEDTIVAGNSIVGGAPAEDNGAGIYVGFGCLKTATSELALIDSTVTANSAPAGGTAGVTGGPADLLVLEQLDPRGRPRRRRAVRLHGRGRLDLLQLQRRLHAGHDLAAARHREHLRRPAPARRRQPGLRRRARDDPEPDGGSRFQRAGAGEPDDGLLRRAAHPGRHVRAELYAVRSTDRRRDRGHGRGRVAASRSCPDRRPARRRSSDSSFVFPSVSCAPAGCCC